jgi:diguanylate cyclase (GGDEF)-like protein
MDGESGRGGGGGQLLPAGHAMLLGMAAAGAPLEQTLSAVADLIEEEIPGSMASIMLLDAEGVLRLATAPSLPLPIVQALAGGWQPGPAAGSCGTAVHLGRPVLSADLTTAPEWARWHPQTTEVGIRACWSVPIIGEGERILGAFALYRTDTGLPSGADVQRLAGYASVVAAAVQRDAASRAAAARTSHDALTGLPTADMVPELLAHALKHCRYDERRVVTLALIDVGRIGDCNRALGYTAGNDLIRAAAARLERHADAETAVARTGGGTFAVIATADDDHDHDGWAEQLLRALAAPFTISGIGFTADPRAALVICRDAADPEDVLATGAERLAWARRSARPVVATADVERAERASDALGLENELRVGLDVGQVIVHYQPVLRLDDGVVLGVEALARWVHPTRGLLGPDVFLPVVERARLQHRLTRIVLDTALADLSRWRRQTGQDLWVAVNVSARELQEEGLATAVSRALAGHDLPGSALTIELTEHDAVADVRATSAVLRHLAGLGVRIGMDDYGTGYSSLTHVRDLVVDHVKIDRSFVARMDVEPSDAAVVAAILGLANGLGLGVVAEGVETAVHRDMLIDLGCDVAQGFLWSQAIPAGEITAMLAATGGPGTPPG